MKFLLKLNIFFIFVLISFLIISSPIFAEEQTWCVSRPQFTIKIPKQIIINQDKTSTYEIIVNGSLDKDKELFIIPDSEFYMSEQSDALNKKEDVLANIKQDKTSWTNEDINEKATGIIEALNLTAGNWNGHFNFNISLNKKEIDYNLFILNRCNYKCPGIKELSGNIVIPETFEKCGVFYKTIGIKEYTFKDCHLLNSIVIPDSITKIRKGVFYNCYTLKDVVLPNNLIKICEEGFMNCHNLVNINLPDSLEIIENRAFKACYTLPDLVIPNNVTYIGDEAFLDCHQMTTVNIPDNISYIGQNAFGNFYNLKKVIYKNVTYTDLSDLLDELKNNNVTVYENSFTQTQLK